MLNVLGLIPARGGSKGLPRKNVRLLHGKPLLEYTVECARVTRLISRILLSTDDSEIAHLGLRLGVEVPFVRPAHLSTDSAPMLPVVQHAVRWCEDSGWRADAVCLLQPTNPFRKASDIDACIGLLEVERADSVVSVLPVPSECNPAWVYFRDSRGFLRLTNGDDNPIPRRQDLPRAYFRDGSVYVTRTAVIEGGSLYGSRVLSYIADGTCHVNIDTPEDWARAERLLDEASCAQ